MPEAVSVSMFSYDVHVLTQHPGGRTVTRAAMCTLVESVKVTEQNC